MCIINKMTLIHILTSTYSLYCIFHRDWRGLEHLTGEKVSKHDNPVEHILHAWEKSNTATLGQLQSFLAQLDRYDVLDDTREMMCK